jgi:hypothetical protein
VIDAHVDERIEAAEVELLRRAERADANEAVADDRGPAVFGEVRDRVVRRFVARRRDGRDDLRLGRVQRRRSRR